MVLLRITRLVCFNIIFIVFLRYTVGVYTHIEIFFALDNSVIVPVKVDLSCYMFFSTNRHLY